MRYYQMAKQYLTITGQFTARFALHTRAGASRLQSGSDNNCYYIVVHKLLEAHCMIGDADGAARVQAAVDRPGSNALAPVTSALVRCSERWYKICTVFCAMHSAKG